MKVPTSSATAEPSMFELSIWLPYKPCICPWVDPRPEPRPEPRFKIRLATRSAAPDRPPPVRKGRLERPSLVPCRSSSNDSSLRLVSLCELLFLYPRLGMLYQHRVREEHRR